MIFSKTWQQVLDGTKTQTRRLVREGEKFIDKSWGWPTNPMIITGNYHTKWQVGRIYAVQPGRGHPAIWIGPDGTSHDAPLAEYLRKASGIDGIRQTWGKHVKAWLREHGYREARFQLTGIRRERLQDISEKDAIAEGFGMDVRHWIRGVTPQTKFNALWDSIHGKGDRWVNNPEVWVLEFKLATPTPPVAAAGTEEKR